MYHPDAAVKDRADRQHNKTRKRRDTYEKKKITKKEKKNTHTVSKPEQRKVDRDNGGEATEDSIRDSKAEDSRRQKRQDNCP